MLAALPEEMRPLRAMLGERAAARRREGESGAADGRGATWRWSSPATVSGTRARKRRRRFGGCGPRLVIAIGVAGAVSPQLALGDTLVAHQVMREQGDAWPAPAPLLAAAARLTQARPGALISDPPPRDDGRRQAAAARRSPRRARPGWRPRSISESAAFVAAAAARGLPWLILRAISDVASEELPALLNDCLDDGGAVRRARARGRAVRTARRAVAAAAVAAARAHLRRGPRGGGDQRPRGLRLR